MKAARADRRIWASIMAAGAAMVLCFAIRSAAMTPLVKLPYAPPVMAQAAEGEEKIDVNSAGLEELMSLPGIGAVKAQAIIDDRQANGPYRYPENLIRVKGIGEETLAGILEQITTGGDDDAQNIGG